MVLKVNGISVSQESFSAFLPAEQLQRNDSFRSTSRHCCSELRFVTERKKKTKKEIKNNEILFITLALLRKPE